MDEDKLTARGKKARERICVAADQLARVYDLGAQASVVCEVRAKDPAQHAMLFLEATADFIERVVAVTIEPPTAAAPARPKPPTRARATVGEE